MFSPPAAAGPSFLWLQSGDLKIFEILITYAQVLLKTETPDQVLTFNLQDYRKVLATGTTQVNEDGTFFIAGAAVCQSLVGRAWSPPARVFILAPLSFHDEVTPWHDRWR